MAGCGRSAQQPLRLPADYVPLPPGRTAAYRLLATSQAVAHRAAVAGLRCVRSQGRAFDVHLEIYAHRLVVPIPAGIGFGMPLRRRGAYVTGGACAYPVHTREPTGLLELTRPGLRLRDLFAVWGQPLGPRRMAGFNGPVAAYVGGRRWRGDPAAIPLRAHAEIVLESGGYVPPHPRYLFPPRL